MLVLARKIGERIRIGDNVIVELLAVLSHGKVRLGIEAPANVRVDREEVRQRMEADNAAQDRD